MIQKQITSAAGKSLNVILETFMLVRNKDWQIFGSSTRSKGRGEIGCDDDKRQRVHYSSAISSATILISEHLHL